MARGYDGRFRATKNDRTSPTFWINEAREHAKLAREGLNDYAELCRRLRGDLSTVPYNEGTVGGAPSSGFGNLTQLRARIMRGDMMFRCPRPQVAPPRYEKAVFTSTLAQIETRLLQDFVDESDYYREMRRAALDLVLAPACIVKIGIRSDAKLDAREIKRQRMKADVEFKLWIMMRRRPKVGKDDSHETHAVQHAQVIAACERGEIPVPDADLDVMRAHLQAHVDKIADRDTDSSRVGRVTIERIHPQSYSCDPWAVRPYDREWHKQAFIERIEDAQQNPDYDREAVKAIEPCKVRRARRDGSGVTAENDWNRDSIETKDLHFQCHEVVDLVESQVVRYAENGTRPLSVRPWTLASILPSGPYEEYSLIEDPDECWGVCPPKVGMEHQLASSELLGIATETVRRGLPMSIINGTLFDEDTIEKLKNGDVAEVLVARNLPPDFDMKKVMASVTPAEIPAQNVGVEQTHRAMAEQMHGLGSAREGGGDQSKTATASVIIGQSANSLAEDGAAGFDDFQSRTLRKVVRLQRGCYSLRQVQDIVGEIALRPGGWPVEGFADADVRDDRAVSVVPGSTRRNESSIKAKMLQEYTTMFMASPLAMVMPKTLAELFRRGAEAIGEYGLGFDELGEVATLEQQLAEQQAAMGMGGDPNADVPPGEAGAGAQGGAGASAPRPSEATDPSAAGQHGAAMNVGGGRLPTGASQGDNPRMMR